MNAIISKVTISILKDTVGRKAIVKYFNNANSSSSIIKTSNGKKYTIKALSK